MKFGGLKDVRVELELDTEEFLALPKELQNYIFEVIPDDIIGEDPKPVLLLEVRYSGHSDPGSREEPPDEEVEFELENAKLEFVSRRSIAGEIRTSLHVPKTLQDLPYFQDLVWETELDDSDYSEDIPDDIYTYDD